MLNIKFLDIGETRLVRVYQEFYDEESAGVRIAYIQITLSNDTDKFEELYDQIYTDFLLDNQTRYDK